MGRTEGRALEGRVLGREEGLAEGFLVGLVEGFLAVGEVELNLAALRKVDGFPVGLLVVGDEEGVVVVLVVGGNVGFIVGGTVFFQVGEAVMGLAEEVLFTVGEKLVGFAEGLFEVGDIVVTLAALIIVDGFAEVLFTEGVTVGVAILAGLEGFSDELF